MEINIDGIIDTGNKNISVDEVTDLFIDWIEAQGWSFGGSIGEWKEDELSS